MNLVYRHSWPGELVLDTRTGTWVTEKAFLQLTNTAVL